MQGDEALEDLLLPHRPGPAVRLGDEGVELVVEVAEDAAGGDLVDGALLRRERRAGAKLFHDVVHPGHRNALVAGDGILAVRVEPLGDVGDAGAQLVRRVGEWEGVEAGALHIYWVITHTELAPSGKRPFDMYR